LAYGFRSFKYCLAAASFGNGFEIVFPSLFFAIQNQPSTALDCDLENQRLTDDGLAGRLEFHILCVR
jgi:hypothetical protein